MGAGDGDSVGGGWVLGCLRSGRAAADRAGALSVPLGGCLTTWRSMTRSDNYFKEVFPVPSLTAFKRQANLRQYIIRAAIPPPVRQRPVTVIKGMTTCGKNCSTCPDIKEGRTHFSSPGHCLADREITVREQFKKKGQPLQEGEGKVFHP